MNARITTFTGRRVDPLDLKPRDIDIRDIAHHLALCNRFAGGTTTPISVAHHSIYVSLLAGEPQANPAIWRAVSLQGLLHDASEAYLGDVTKWLKATDAMAAYREAEDRAMQVILSFYDLPIQLFPEVEAADKLMVRFEHEMGYGTPISIPECVRPGYEQTTEEERLRIGGWQFISWEHAEAAFLRRFDEVRRRMRR